MSAGRPTKPLGELAAFVNGRAFQPSDWGKSGLPIIRIQNLTDREKPFNYYSGKIEEKHRIRNGDVLVSWSASLGSFEWDRGDAALNQHIFKVVENDGVDRQYLRYAIENALDVVKAATHGSTMKHITKGEFESVEVPFPDYAEQRRIVARIREAMERVEEMERLTRDVLDCARDLVKAELQTIIHDQRRAGHETVLLGAVTRTSGYGTSQRAHEEPRGVPVLRMGNIVDGQIDETDLKFIELSPPELARQRLMAGDVLVNRTNSLELVGKAAAFDPSTGERVAAS